MSKAQAAEAQDITVGPANSPYMLPSPSASFGTVTLQTGGYLEAHAATSVNIQSLVKTAADGVTIDRRDVTKAMRHFRG